MIKMRVAYAIIAVVCMLVAVKRRKDGVTPIAFLGFSIAFAFPAATDGDLNGVGILLVSMMCMLTGQMLRRV